MSHPVTLSLGLRYAAPLDAPSRSVTLPSLRSLALRLTLLADHQRRCAHNFARITCHSGFLRGRKTCSARPSVAPQGGAFFIATPQLTAHDSRQCWYLISLSRVFEMSSRQQRACHCLMVSNIEPCFLTLHLSSCEIITPNVSHINASDHMDLIGCS